MCIIIYLYCEFCKSLNLDIFNIEECLDFDVHVHQLTRFPYIVVKVRESFCLNCAEELENNLDECC